MRDAMSWSVPLFRAFGIQVRVHFLYILITIIMLWREIDENPKYWWEFALIWIVLLFFIILCHEFGHCFAARRVDGNAEEILMWPLGGLAFCDVPKNPDAHWYTAVGGPLVNVFFFTVAGIVLILASYIPPLNPFQIHQLVTPEMHCWKDGQTHVPRGYSFVALKERPNEFVYGPRLVVEKQLIVIDIDQRKAFEAIPKDPPRYADWVLWVARFFWMNWFLFLFNLLPAFPMDGGRILQCILWRRSDYATATRWAAYTGFVIAAICFVLSMVGVAPMLITIAVIVVLLAYQQLYLLDMGMDGDSPYGDFSQGYTSLEQDDPPPPKPKKLGPIKRWLQARRNRKMQREAEQREMEEARMDELLDKIARLGKESLTDEERRFLDRVSARYRNR